jgi:hypothetical protein
VTDPVVAEKLVDACFIVDGEDALPGHDYPFACVFVACSAEQEIAEQVRRREPDSAVV